MSVSPETFRSSLIALENLEDTVETITLRSQDSYDFRVPKLYIVHSSPILRENILSPNPQPGRSGISTEPDVEGTANAHQVVQLPVYSAILISLLSYIFPVQPILPPSAEQIMELLSVAQMYKMDVVLTHIRNHIAQQQPPFIRKETAFFVYALAQKHGLRKEALQAAQCTLNNPPLIIEDLAKEDKLGLMSGASLHELWKYHEGVWSSFAVAPKEFISLHHDELKMIGNMGCDDDKDLPCWLDFYTSHIGNIPFSLAFADFHMKFVEHSQGIYRRDRQECPPCLRISEGLHALWEILMAILESNITKAETRFTLSIEETRSQNEVRARSSMESPTLPKYSDMPNPDVILQSSDLINFCVHQPILVTSSPFFRDMFSLPQPANDIEPDGLPVLHLSESAEVLDNLISMLYPVPPEMPHSIDNILALLAATDKYDMGAVQSFIRAEVARKELLSPTDSAGVYRMYAVACSKKLIPEMESAARLSLNHPLTFESVGEALRLLDGWALRGLAEFRKRCTRDLESGLKSLSDRGQNGPSKIWAGCTRGGYLSRFFRIYERCRFESFDKAIIPTSERFRQGFLAALREHINIEDCHFCLKVYMLNGEEYCAEMRDVLEHARNIPAQIFGDSPGD